MIKKASVAALLAISLIFLVLVPTSQAKQPSRAIIVLINATDLKEIQSADMPTIQKLIKEKKLAAGLMNARPGKAAYAKTSGYLSIGTGAKANAGQLSSLGFNSDEKFTYQEKEYKADEWYRHSTGFKLDKGQIVNIGIVDMSRLSTKYDYPLAPGLLGNLLKENGIKRAVIGNADGVDDYHREATLIAMDSTGKVDYGDVSGPFVGDKNQELLAKTKQYLKKARFIVVEDGQMARLDYSRPFLTDKQYANYKKQALKDTDKFLKGLLQEVDLKKDMVIIASPTPTQLSQKQNDYLTPIFIVRENQQSFVYAQSTKWPGMVNNMDIAPTILKFLSIKQPPQMSGAPISSNGSDSNPLISLLSAQKTAAININVRTPILTAYVVIIIAAIILSVLLLFLKDVRAGAFKLAQALLLFLISVPPVLLLFSLTKYANPWILIIGAPVASLLLTIILMYIIKNAYQAMLFTFSATVAVIIADVATGSFLMRNSILGFSPTVGARFYGLGNEYMGVIIGAAILSLSLIKDLDVVKLKKSPFVIIAALIFLAITFAIGFPGLGANVGGALAAAVGFTFSLFYLGGARFSWKQPVIVLAALILVVSAIFLSDKIFGFQTHAGKAGALIAQGGIAEAVQIFKRKIVANFRLVRFTAWSNVLITILVIMPILFMKPAGAVKRLKEKMPNVWAGVIGVLFGSIAAFIFNDSGVVAAATCLLYATVIVLYAIIDDQVSSVDREIASSQSSSQ